MNNVSFAKRIPDTPQKSRVQLFLSFSFLLLESRRSGRRAARLDFAEKKNEKEISLSIYKNPAELPACPARIYTRRLVATNEIHETDIRAGPQPATLPVSQCKHSGVPIKGGTVEKSGARGRTRPSGVKRKNSNTSEWSGTGEESGKRERVSEREKGGGEGRLYERRASAWPPHCYLGQ